MWGGRSGARAYNGGLEAEPTPPTPPLCKNSSDLYQFQQRPLAKVGWTCPPQSIPWRRQYPPQPYLVALTAVDVQPCYIVIRALCYIYARREKMRPIATDVAWSACLSVCWSQLQKRMDRLMCQLGCRLSCAQGTTCHVGARIPPTQEEALLGMSGLSRGRYSLLHSVGGRGDAACRCADVRFQQVLYCSNLFTRCQHRIP